MSAGTLTLTNNSAAVSGSGTSFTTELAAADFIVVTVGGIPYTLPVKTVDSTTALTLVSNYTGPTQAGAAWYAMPRVAMNLVTASLVAQSAEALRGLNYDKQNWQQLFTGSGTITVKLPDQSTFTGPAWGGITASLNNLSIDVGNRAMKGANNDITSLIGLTTPLSRPQGGTGLASPFGSTAGTFCQGNDARLDTLNNKTGGVVSSDISLQYPGGTFSRGIAYQVLAGGAEGVYVRGSMATFSDGTQRTVLNQSSVGGRRSVLFANGGIICQNTLASPDPYLNSYFISWNGSVATLAIDSTMLGSINVTPISDKFLKKDITYVSTADQSAASSEVAAWKVANFRYIARGCIPESDTKLGFIANDIVTISPECVTGSGLEEGFDPLYPKDPYNLDPIAMIAKLTLAIQAQQKQISELQSLVKQISTGS